jgi:hypothetical protein
MCAQREVQGVRSGDLHTGTNQVEHRLVRKAFTDLGLQHPRKMCTSYPRDTTYVRPQLFVASIDARNEVYSLEAPAPPSIALPMEMDYLGTFRGVMS